MENQKDTSLLTETTLNQSKGILPNESKGKYIPYSVEELQQMKEKSAFDLAHLIKQENWLKMIYSGDWEHNKRLNFVRMFYYQEFRGIKPQWKKDKEAYDKSLTEGQQQLNLL